MSSVARSAQILLTAQAREAVDRLMVRYGSVIDNGDFEAWPQLFTEDGAYRIVTRSDHQAGRDFGVWYCSNRGMIEDRVSSIRSVNVYEPHVYRHVIGATEILAVDGPEVACETSYIVVRTDVDGDMIVFSAGRYVDSVALDGDAALLRSRVVVTDSARFDTLVALPL